MRAAVIMLACSDFEAMELALACHASYLPRGVCLYVLQNCRGTYDAERTLMAARRFERLHPRQIRVVDDIPPGPPYRSLAALLASAAFKDIDLICKVDDDTFPIAPGWLEALLNVHTEASRDASPLAYVTPLINNNNWGFAETLDVMGLREPYLSSVAADHVVGAGTASDPHRVVMREEICTGAHGTIWAAPHIARWLHEHTTLDPDRFIAATRGLEPKQVPSVERYSIGCIAFRRDLWAEIDDGGDDDEELLQRHCRKTGARIVCARSVPLVHLAYFPQREENRDIIPQARTLYEKRLGLGYPIALRASREFEIEARLRWLEGQGLLSAPPSGTGAIGALGGLTPEQFVVRAARGLTRAMFQKLSRRLR